MTFDQFQQTRERLTLDHPYHGEVDVYAYNIFQDPEFWDDLTTDDVLHIVINQDEKPIRYELSLDRSTFESDDLGQLEKWLYDFAIAEGLIQ